MAPKLILGNKWQMGRTFLPSSIPSSGGVAHLERRGCSRSLDHCLASPSFSGFWNGCLSDLCAIIEIGVNAEDSSSQTKRKVKTISTSPVKGFSFLDNARTS